MTPRATIAVVPQRDYEFVCVPVAGRGFESGYCEWRGVLNPKIDDNKNPIFQKPNPRPGKYPTNDPYHGFKSKDPNCPCDRCKKERGEQ